MSRDSSTANPETSRLCNEASGSKRYFIRHWRGQLSLGASVWRNGLGTLLVLPGVTGVLNLTHDVWSRSPNTARVSLYLFVAVGFLWFTSSIWSNVGIWRSANHHVGRGGLRRWAWGAKLFVALRAPVDTAMFVFAVCVPSVYLVATALGRVHQVGQISVVISSDGATAYVSGDVGEGSAAVLARALRASPSLKTIQLNSAGGRIYEAIEAAKVIHALNVETHVDRYCHSACTFLFMAGRRRSVSAHATLAFHKPIYSGFFELKNQNESMLSFFRAYGATDEFLDRLRRLRDGEIWTPTQAELLEYNLTSPASTMPPNGVR